VSDDTWVFQNKNDLIYIENTLTKKVLGSTNDGKVSLEDYEEGNADQLWKKGEPDAEGYLTLQNSGEPKVLTPIVLTAISESSLEIKDLKDEDSKSKFINTLFTEIPKERKCDITYVKFFERRGDLEAQKNKVVSPTEFKDDSDLSLNEFVHDLIPTAGITAANVTDIDTNYVNELTKKIEELRGQIEQMEKDYQLRIKELELNEREKKKLEEDHKREIKELEKKIREISEKQPLLEEASEQLLAWPKTSLIKKSLAWHGCQ